MKARKPGRTGRTVAGAAASPGTATDPGTLRRASKASATTAASPARWALPDLLRGVTLLAMIAYHFCFDLATFGWIDADFGGDWRWIVFRTPILGSFLFIAGFSLALAAAAGVSSAQFAQRLARLAGAAALVSAGSWLMFPQSFIWFGVLHGILVMSVLTRPLLRWGAWLIPLGIAIVVAGQTLHFAWFDHPAVRWIGLMTFKPRTEDYVPLFPWWGLLLAGAGTGCLVLARPAWRAALGRIAGPAGTGWIGWLGRHSLAVYLIHQPVLIGALMAVRALG